MGLFDDVLGGASGLGRLAAQNPQAVAAVLSLLSSRDTSVGGSGGLGGLIQAFQGKGLGSVVSSWISTGPNPPVSAGQLNDVLGTDVLREFAAKAGVPQQEAGGLLASLLPDVVDGLTPQGEVPSADNFEAGLGGLLQSLTR